LHKQGYKRGIQNYKSKMVNPYNSKQIWYEFEFGEIESG